MNFDIKYTKYLQIFNFTKIKQVLGTSLGAQSWDNIAKALNRPRCKLGRSINQTDKWDPQTREKEKVFAGKQREGGQILSVHEL